MIRKIKLSILCSFLFVGVLIFPGWFLNSATAGGYPFDIDHNPPYEFEFGNHIDTHQQSRLKNNDDLSGFLYIVFTGGFVDGIPVAKHPDNNTPVQEREVGWIIRGKPGSATFVFHDGDHPIWLVFSRNDIPQPGAFSHFHWTGDPANASGFTTGEVSDGFFLELQAIDTFYFEHGGETILVTPGIDLRTHVNIVGSFP